MSTRSEHTQTLEVQAARDARQARVMVHAWTLEVVSGPDKGRSFTTQDTLVRVGSDGQNDLVLTDPTVSRRHVEFERTPRGLLVRDLGSRNGVLLDGRPVLQAWVEDGDRVVLGTTKLQVRVSAETTEVEVVSGADHFGELVGASERMRVVLAQLRRFAREDMHVLLEGETGTGKELAARALHAHSGRRHGPFRVVDCHLVSPQRAGESLFGALLGAADEGQGKGALEAAQGGTLFLDEVSELPAEVQPLLLRVLETRTVPGRDGAPVPVDVRVVASTSRNLEEEARQGRFRADLFYRLAVARVRLPPLRARKEDIPVLAGSLLRSLRREGTELTPQALALLEGYDWPGNVRELRNVLERGAVMEAAGTGSWLDVLAEPGEGGAGARVTPATQSVGALAAGLPYHEAKDRVLADFERVYFAEVMRLSNFDMKAAEERTGLSMQSLYRLLKKNGLRMRDLKNAEGLDK